MNPPNSIMAPPRLVITRLTHDNLKNPKSTLITLVDHSLREGVGSVEDIIK